MLLTILICHSSRKETRDTQRSWKLGNQHHDAGTPFKLRTYIEHHIFSNTVPSFRTFSPRELYEPKYSDTKLAWNQCEISLTKVFALACCTMDYILTRVWALTIQTHRWFRVGNFLNTSCTKAAGVFELMGYAVLLEIGGRKALLVNHRPSKTTISEEINDVITVTSYRNHGWRSDDRAS